MDLDNQVALITGAASGMGQATAMALLKKGAKVILWDKQFLNQEKDDFSLSMPCDVRSEEEVDTALKIAITEMGIPRICVNCAGIAPAKLMVGKDVAMPLESFKQVIDINLIGTFNVMKAVAFAMSRIELTEGGNERGIIINTASIAAFEGQIGQTAYSASKGGVVSMTLPAARELAKFAIRVNTIAPGLIATPMLLAMPEEVQEKLKENITFPKRFGKPEEFSSLVLHLIENELINGAVIRLDAALRMQSR